MWNTLNFRDVVMIVGLRHLIIRDLWIGCLAKRRNKNKNKDAFLREFLGARSCFMYLVIISPYNCCSF